MKIDQNACPAISRPRPARCQNPYVPSPRSSRPASASAPSAAIGERAADRDPGDAQLRQLIDRRCGGKCQHVDGPVDGRHDGADVRGGGQARRVEHVGACLLVALQTRDGVGQVRSSVQIVLGARGEDDGAGGGLRRRSDALGGKLERVYRVGAGRRCDPRCCTRRARPRLRLARSRRLRPARRRSRSPDLPRPATPWRQRSRPPCAIASSRVTLPSRRPSVAAKPLLVVASAPNPSAASTRAEPASHGFGSNSGSPGTCRARNPSASAVISGSSPSRPAARQPAMPWSRPRS